MMASYMAKFILQIWKCLRNAHLFSCILLISTCMFLSGQAKSILLWIITLPQNIDETCQVCNKKVQSFSHNKQCSNCLAKYHTKCINWNKDRALTEFWYCPYCVQTNFPYKHFDDDIDFFSAVIEGMLHCSFRLHEINSKVFTPFEINDTVDTPFSDIDPDYQYYANLHHTSNLNCDYHF